ncbi:MAG TPA: hypothetical protein VK174_08350 [Chitinophagales bacterium]|nr:hypothetical protein [Chitinophagales bacterium]
MLTFTPMKMLRYFEKAWIGVCVLAFVVGLYNLVTLRSFDNRVYFPFFCGLFCILIWYNIRGQRRFREKMIEENEQKHNPAK